MRPLPSADITLGLLAGGPATRLGGIDKAWLTRGGIPQVLRWAQRFPGEHGPVLVAANRDPGRYAVSGLSVVSDRFPGRGPFAALDALAQACATPWLFTLPVDVVGLNDCLLRTLVSMRGHDGVMAEDDAGVQPLVALWRRDALRAICAQALADGLHDEEGLAAARARMRVSVARFAGLRFGGVDTPEDMRVAGLQPEQTPTSGRVDRGPRTSGDIRA